MKVTIFLDGNRAIRENKKYVIIRDGKRILLDHHGYVYVTKNSYSMEDIYKEMEGTKGIKSIKLES